MRIAIALNLFDVLRLRGGADYLRVFEADRLQALARVHLSTSRDAYYVGWPFYGLASGGCSTLWLKSNYIPRAWAAWGAISSVGCTMCAFAFIICPNFDKTVNPYWFDSPMAILEMATSSWLLFMGIRAPLAE